MIASPAPYWQVVLEAFVDAKDPLTLTLPAIKLNRQLKNEAASYLEGRGLLEPRGRVLYDDISENTYVVTQEGRFLFAAIKGSFRERAGKMVHADTTVAQRAVAASPIDVFDLVRVPWVWDRAAEKGEEQAEAFAEGVRRAAS